MVGPIPRPMSTLNFDYLLGRNFLPHQENEEHKCALIVDHFVDFDDLQTAREDQLCIKISVQDPELFEEFISYNLTNSWTTWNNILNQKS